MNPIVGVALSRSRTVLCVLAVILFAGFAAYLNIPKEGDPETNIPFVMVSAIHHGISPEDAERLLGRPLEQELGGLEGVRQTQIIAGEGYLRAVLEFEAGADIDSALLDVREKVDRAQVEFPAETEEPMVFEFNTALNPVIRVNVYGQLSERTLFRLARRLKERIEGIPNVLEAQMYGYREEMLEILIDEARLDAYQIDLSDFIRAVTFNNALVAAGTLDTGKGRFQVKVPGLIEIADDVRRIPLVSSGDGVVTIGDIARVRRTFQDDVQFARLDGKPAIGIGVSKRIGKNIIETVAAVKEVVQAEMKTWPDGAYVKFTDNDANEIFDILRDLQANVIAAILLVMTIVIFTLGWQSAMLVGVAIPSSFLLTFLLLDVSGNTVNMMVLFSLIIAVGMLVDGAIVVIEYADRKIAQGFDRRTAYGAAATRMFWPIVSSTLTTLSAFLPMLFWPGLTGEFMFFLPVTLILTLSGSLLAAIWFLPAMGSLIGRSTGTRNDIEAALDLSADSKVLAGDQHKLYVRAYSALIERVIRHPVIVIVVSVVAIYSVFVMYGNYHHGVILISQQEAGGARIVVSARGNLSTEEVSSLVLSVENVLLKTEGVGNIFSAAAAGEGGNVFDQTPRDAVGIMYMEFEHWRTRRRVADIVRDLRMSVAKIPGIQVQIDLFERSLGTSKDVHLELFSKDRTDLSATAARVRAFFDSEIEGIVDIDDTDRMSGIDWQLTVDREQAERFGANVAMVGSAVQLITNGLKVGEYRPDDADDELDIRLRLPRADRGLDRLDQIRVRTEQGMVPISHFVHLTPQRRVSTIERIDKAWVIAIRANTLPGVLADDKVNEIRDWLENEADLPPGIQYRFGGEDRLQAESAGFIQIAFIAALALMGAILLTQFNSFYHSFLILTAVVMSTAGALLGMLITGQPFSMILSGTGVIALAGIVVNNNIVLIDTYQRLIRSGLDPLTAIQQTGQQRLRPILLTTVTTIVGLMPMVLQISVDLINWEISYGSPNSYFWMPLSTAIVFGLGFSTLLTLIVTPSALALPAVLKMRFKTSQSLFWVAIRAAHSACARFLRRLAVS